MQTLEIQNLNIRTDDREIVFGANLLLKEGEVHVLMGPNGCGKSTLLNAMMGHPKYTITDGTILLNEKNITDLETEQKARLGLFLSMQYLPEIAGVTMANFLYQAYKATAGDSDISTTSFYKTLEEKAKAFDINSDFLKKHVNVGLSGGEKKLSEVLQLAALEPKFAFLDEIDSGVDVDSLKKVFNAILSLQKKGTGFLLITHYSALLDHITPDFVHIMKDGRIIESGGHELVSHIVKNGYNTIADK